MGINESVNNFFSMIASLKSGVLLITLSVIACSAYTQKKLTSNPKDTVVGRRANIYINNVKGDRNEIVNGDKVVNNKTVVNKITKKYVDSSTSNYLVVNADSLNLELNNALFFKPISKSVGKEIVDSLSALQNRFPGLFLPDFAVELGDEKRVKVVKEFTNLMKVNNFRFWGPHFTSSGNPGRYSAEITIGDSVSVEFVEGFLNCLRPYVTFNTIALGHDLPMANRPYLFDFIIRGTPFFNKDGTVVFE